MWRERQRPIPNLPLLAVTSDPVTSHPLGNRVVRARGESQTEVELLKVLKVLQNSLDSQLEESARDKMQICNGILQPEIRQLGFVKKESILRESQRGNRAPYTNAGCVYRLSVL